MTLIQAATELYKLAEDGEFCYRHFTKEQFVNGVKNTFNAPAVVGMQSIIKLPDGVWYCEVKKLRDGEYDYYIPETREAERRWADRAGFDLTYEA